MGKSAIVLQFVTGNYVSEYDPTIEDSYRKQFALGDKVVMADMLDTAGMEEFSAMRDQWMRTHNGFIIVFGLDSRSSFNDTEAFFEQIVRVKDGLPFCAVLVGNKCDDVDHRQVESAEAIAMARRWNVPYVEATAKESVDHIFAHLLYDMEAARVALATAKEKEEPATKKTEANKNSTWQQDMLALVNEPSSADIRIFIDHQGAVSGPIFGHSMIIGRQSPKLRELFAQAKQSAGACGVGQAADELPAVTLSHVSPAVLQFLLGYFYSSTLALPSFLEPQGQAVIAELYRSIGGTSDAPKAPEAADSSSKSADAEGMRRAWKLVRRVYKSKRPYSIILDPVDVASTATVGPESVAAIMPLLQRVMAQGVSTAGAAHLCALLQHMHAFAAAYEISALQEFLDQRLAALNLLSECGKAMDQVMSVVAPFFEEWEAVKASSATPASAYFARFLELLARHGVRFVFEMVRFVKLLADVRGLMGADVMRMLTTLIVDRADAVFLRLSLALVDLHLARTAHEGETEQASAEYVTRLLVQWELLLDPLAALLDARQCGGAVTAAADGDGDAGATASEGDEAPAAAEKKTKNLEHTLNLRKKEKKRRAQSPDEQAKYFRSYMKTGLSSLKEFLPELREELIKHATGKPTTLTRKHLPTFFNDLADNLCKWSKANKHYNEAMHHPNLVTAAVEQLVAALAYGREAEKHIGRDIHAVAQVVLSDELREILIETGVIKREYASEADEQNKPGLLANGKEKATATPKTEEPEIETSKAKEVAKADESEHGATTETSKEQEGGDRAVAEAQPDRTKAFLPRLGIEAESDLAFVVEGQRIFCYRAVLMGRSQHFRISFTGYMERYTKEIPVPDHSCAAFAAFLHYLYYDQLPHLDASDNATLVGWCDGQFRVASPLSAGDVLLEVVAISDEYHHEHLKELVLGQLLPFVDVDNVVFLHMMAQLYNATDLRNKCVAVMSDNFEKIHDEHFPAALKVLQGVVPQEATASEAEAESSSGHKEDRIELDEATAQQLIKGWEERRKQVAQCQKGFLFVPPPSLHV